MQQTVFKNKFLTVLFSMLFAIASVFVLSACGEEPTTPSNTTDTSQQISYIEVSTTDAHYDNTAQRLEFTYGDEIDLNNIQFTVTAHKFNGDTITLNQNDFTFDASGLENAKVDGKVPADLYTVQFTVNKDGNTIQNSLAVQVNKAKLVIPDISADDLEIAYDGQEHNVITEKIDALIPQGYETLSSMISTGKVVFGEEYGTYDYYTDTATDVYRDGAQVSDYYISVVPTSNYDIIHEPGSDSTWTFVSYSWSITPRVLNLPHYANNGQVQFDWEVVNDEVQVKTAEMSLVYGNGIYDLQEDMFDIISGSLTSNNFGSSEVIVELRSAYTTNYALAGEEAWFSTSASLGYWSVTPYVFDADHFAMDTTNADGTYYDAVSEKSYPNFNYNPEGLTLSLNLTSKEKQLFEFMDEGANWNYHFANNESAPLYSYGLYLRSSMQTLSSAFCVGSTENILDTNSLTQYYHISRIDAPADVQSAILGYTLELQSETYNSDYPITLNETYDLNNFTTATQEQFSDTVYRQGVASGDYSIFELRQAQDVSNANESGYTVALNFYYGYINYNPIEVDAKLVVNRASFIVGSIYNHFDDNDNGRGPLIYRYNQSIPMSVMSADVFGGENLDADDFAAVTYKYSATQDGTYNTVASPTNAGFYKATTSISVANTNYKYVAADGLTDWLLVEDENDATKFNLTYSFEIGRRPIYVSETYSGTWGTYYYSPYSFFTNEAKTFIVETTPILYYFQTSGTTSLTQYETALSADELADIELYLNRVVVTKQGNSTITNPTDVGDYTTTIGYSFNENSNYVFIGQWDDNDSYDDNPYYYETYQNRLREEISFTQEWSIISTSIDLSGVSWSANTFEWTGLGQAPEIENLPKGVYLNYGGSYGQYMYGTVGSTQTSAPYSIGSWFVRTRFVVNESVQGYNATTPPTITAYPAGYDTSNNYFEQAYTITTRTLTLGKTDFAAYIYEDYSWVKVGDVNADGTVTATVPFSMESQIIHIMPTDVSMRSYVQTDGTVTVASADAGTSSQTASVITVTPSTNCQFADSITEIQIVVSWTITKKVLPAHIQYWSVYLYVDGGSNDVLLLEGLLDYTDNINATGIFGDPVGVPYSGSTQYIYLKGQYSDYVTITYDGSTDKIAVSGEVGNTSDGKVHIVIAPTSNSEFEKNDKDATELTIELGWIIVNAE